MFSEAGDNIPARRARELESSSAPRASPITSSARMSSGAGALLHDLFEQAHNLELAR